MDRLWWENITNTSHFIDQIVETVQSGSHLFLQLPQFVPWYETMSDLVISKIERQNSDRSLKIIMDSGKDPGEYLFYQYCRQEKRAQYRPGIGYAQFLAKSEELIMNHYILWITQADAAQAKKWYTFLEGYSKALGKGKKGCIFLIETREDVPIIERGSIKRLVYEKDTYKRVGSLLAFLHCFWVCLPPFPSAFFTAEPSRSASLRLRDRITAKVAHLFTVHHEFHIF